MSNPEEEYQKSMDYLYSFVDFSLTRGMQIKPDQFNLGRMRDFMAALGNPERAYPSLHIAGTKGKGSVAAFCSSILQSAGYKTGLYTSPHLHDYVERIQVDGQPMPHRALVELIAEIKPAIASVAELTTFEITTGLALLYFQWLGVDAAVLEVGLGGRLDATNVVTPSVCVITSISYDHTQILGNTLAEIAGEKAGILKPGIPAVCGAQPEEALAAIERIAGERGAPLTVVGREAVYAAGSRSLEGQTFSAWEAGDSPGEAEEFTIPLLGLHQVENAATAYAAMRTFARAALPVSMEAIRRGFAAARWPGRFEVMQRDPAVVIDSAHNRDSALRLRQALADYFPGRPVIWVFGASDDKDIEGMAAELAPCVKEVIAVKSFHPRAAEPEKLVENASRYGLAARIIPDVAEALRSALENAAPGDVVLAAGSIFVAAGAREAWLSRIGETK
ncbi:MAG: bifunctional folylpolyglutamate synthase/dihydrofolate synthase [Chloroflexi bacterium]|nr:bifunctional folylpolyglutamate synthase/dihydrofolate synthase [Chloroflexota bacterium]